MKRRRFQSLEDVPSRLRERILLWVVTPFPTYLALLFVSDLLDGKTRAIRGQPVTIWENPDAFAMAGGLCAVFCIVASLFWLAVINNWNEAWLPPKLRNRPHLAIVALIVATAVAILLGRQLLTGEITLTGRRAHLVGRDLTIDGTPIRFVLVCATYLLICGAIALGWIAALRRWVHGPRGRWRPTFDDPTKRRRLD